MISYKDEKLDPISDLGVSSKEDLLDRIKDLEANQLQLNNIIKKLEKELRMGQSLFYKFCHALPVPLVIMKKENLVHEILNGHMLELTGYTAEEIIGTSMHEIQLFVEETEKTDFVNEICRECCVKEREARLRTKSGKVITVILSAVVINVYGSDYILIVGRDITQLKTYQKEMARLDCLHLVGEMAASISHEIRNPMTTVRGFLQLLSKKDQYALDKNYMDLMIEELDRANGIITEYLSLAKNKAVEKKRQSLNQRIRTIFSLIQAEALKQEKSIKLELGEIPYTVMDKNEIHQLLLNLIRNGLDAMAPGGVLTIKTYREGDQVVLSVIDQGQGIAPEILDKIGTPFFSTKENGTGLGLSVCYSIVQRHNAEITIDTSPSGTTFCVKFKV
ncbi:MAG: two-component system sensor histidine kinase NtrB [Pelotomaculum sp.]